MAINYGKGKNDLDYDLLISTTSNSTANLYWTFNLQYYRITVNIKDL